MGPKLQKLSMLKGQLYVYSILRHLLWNRIIFCNMSLHDTWCSHSCMTSQKVPYPAPLCPQILAGALLRLIMSQLWPFFPFTNSEDPDLKKPTGSALFVIKSVNLHQQLGSSYLIGCQFEVGLTSLFIQHDKDL